MKSIEAIRHDNTPKLRVSSDLDLPLDAVTRRIAWMGSTGSGKTFGCKRMVEQMLRARAQVVILDGMGVWPGLRLGPKPFDVPVFGGLYGDIPLEPTAGALVADVIVDRATSMVLDVSQMLDAERTRFATAFGQRFFQRKKAAPSAVHLVLEECQEFVPENYQPGEQRMLHEFVRISKQGRTFGIGVSFISQRPQEIAKRALNQAECVFAFAMSGTQERKALQYWLSDKGCDVKLADVLPHLEIGAPHVWSPGWLKVSKVVRILPIETVDTSSTPKVGEKSYAKKLGPIDLKELTAAMADTIERAKADDPQALRARIAEIEKALTKKVPAVTTKVVEPRGIKLEPWEVVIDGRDLKAIVDAASELEERCAAFDGHFADLRRAVNVTDRAVRRARQTGPAALGKRLEKVARILPKSAHPQTSEVPKAQPRTTPSHANPADYRPKANGASDLGNSGARRMLTVLCQSHGFITPSQLALRAGIVRRGGTFRTYLGKLLTSGWAERQGDRLTATEAGRQTLGPVDPLPRGADLFAFWMRELGSSGAARMLEALYDAYPKALSKAELGARTDIAVEGGTFRTYLGKLKTLELVEGKGEIRLSEELVG